MVFIVVQKDIWRIRKSWTALCIWRWISVCLQSLSWPWTPGKMRRWNVLPHVAKSNTTHNVTQEDTYLRLKTAQQQMKTHMAPKAFSSIQEQRHLQQHQKKLDMYLAKPSLGRSTSYTSTSHILWHQLM